MSFQDRIGKRNEQFLLKVNKTKASVALALYSQIVRGTPVDQGRARGNWIPSTITPVSGVTRGATPPESAITQAKAEWAGAKLEDDLIFQNNLPYIYRLEYEDWSQQAQGGWVRAAVGRFREIIRRAWYS